MRNCEKCGILIDFVFREDGAPIFFLRGDDAPIVFFAAVARQRGRGVPAAWLRRGRGSGPVSFLFALFVSVGGVCGELCGLVDAKDLAGTTVEQSILARLFTYLLPISWTTDLRSVWIGLDRIRPDQF